MTRTVPSSIYQALSDPRDAELFFRLGFHDTDSWCSADPAELDETWFCLDRNVIYLRWLAKHGPSSWQFKSFESGRGTFVANFTFMTIGIDLTNLPKFWIFNKIRSGNSLNSTASRSGESLPLDERRAWIHEVNAAVLPAEIADNCHCKCSPGGCTPVVSLLKGISRWDWYVSGRARRNSPEHSVAEDTDSPEDSIAGDTNSSEDTPQRASNSFPTYFAQYLELFGRDLGVRHHTAALRYVTFTALGIPHSCCDPRSPVNDWK